MKNAFSILFIMLLLVAEGKADSPPTWAPYKVISKNGEFFSWLHFVDTNTIKSPWQRRWALTVYTKDSVQLWQQQIEPTGYPEGILSNDGEYFSYVDYWYYPNSPVVEVYRREKEPIIITGDKFNIPPQFLQKTSSHQVWLHDKGYHYAERTKHQLIINTRDSNSWVVDLETGELKIARVSTNYIYVILALIVSLLLSYILIKRGSNIASTNEG